MTDNSTLTRRHFLVSVAAVGGGWCWVSRYPISAARPAGRGGES